MVWCGGIYIHSYSPPFSHLICVLVEYFHTDQITPDLFRLSSQDNVVSPQSSWIYLYQQRALLGEEARQMVLFVGPQYH